MYVVLWGIIFPIFDIDFRRSIECYFTILVSDMGSMMDSLLYFAILNLLPYISTAIGLVTGFVTLIYVVISIFKVYQNSME